MLEDSNARHTESTENFTAILSELQERIRTFEKVHTNRSSQSTTAQPVDVEVQTDVNSSDIEIETSVLNKVLQNCTISRSYIIFVLISVVLALAVSVTITLHANYYNDTTAKYSLPTVQEFHEKVSFVLYEIIEQSELPWLTKLNYWSSITIVAPVVLRFSEFSKQKNSVLKSNSFYAFTNGYLMRLRIYPSGYSAVGTKGNYLSVYLDLLKGPHDDDLEKLGYFPIKKSFTIELLDPTMCNSHLQVKYIFSSKKCNISRVTTNDKIVAEYAGCGNHHFIPLTGYDFKQPYACPCNIANPTICCFISNDDTLYFRVKEHK